jgi:hypothetical protein
MAILDGPNSTNVSQVLSLGGRRKDRNNDRVYGVGAGKTFFKKQDFAWHHVKCPGGYLNKRGSWSNNPTLVDMRVFRAIIRTFSRFSSEQFVNLAFWTPEGQCLRVNAQLEVDSVVHTGGGRHVVHRR